jgi:hypothetical protein
MSRGRKKPLYRKVNTQTHKVRHRVGGNYRDQRHNEDAERSAMSHGVRRGRDYTPLFRFLLSRVGDDWDEVHSEAVSRLDTPDPIFWLVALRKEDCEAVVRVEESTYFSGLYVDENNRLRVVAPEIGPASLKPFCPCCTHTLNGIPFVLPFRPADW